MYFGVFQASDYAYTTGYNQSAYTNPYAYYPYMTSGLSTSSIASQPPQTYQLITPPPTTTTTTTESSFTGTGSGSTPSPPLKSENGNNKNWSPPPSSPSDDKSDAGLFAAEFEYFSVEIKLLNAMRKAVGVKYLFRCYRGTPV